MAKIIIYLLLVIKLIFNRSMAKYLIYFIMKLFNDMFKNTIEFLEILKIEKNNPLMSIICGQCNNYDCLPDKFPFIFHAFLVSI